MGYPFFKEEFIVDYNEELWTLLGVNKQKSILYPKMSNTLPKIVPWQRLRLFLLLILLFKKLFRLMKIPNFLINVVHSISWFRCICMASPAIDRAVESAPSSEICFDSRISFLSYCSLIKAGVYADFKNDREVHIDQFHLSNICGLLWWMNPLIYYSI